MPDGAILPDGWDLSLPDWSERIQRGESLVPKLPHLTTEGDRAVKIFERLRLPDIEGLPTFKEKAGEWQRDIVRALFGSWDGETRHIREIFALVPKKSGKTSSSAAIMLVALLMNKRPRAEFLLVGASLTVADLAFNAAVGMIAADPVLARKFHVTEHQRKITYRPTGAFLKVKTFDPKIVTGSKPAGILLDELHAMAETKDADRVIGQLRGGMVSQAEGFLITITTQSERAPSGVFRQELLTAREIRDGTLTGVPTLPILYEFPPGVEWRDQANWHMVNPNLGRSFKIEALAQLYKRAATSGQAELNRWASQHLNVEIGIAQLARAWPGARHWLKRVDEGITLQTIMQRCDCITAGLDGGGLDDLQGLGVIGREHGTDHWLGWGKAWVHPDVLEARESEAARLKDFEQDGDLTISEDIVGMIEEAVSLVAKIHDEGKLGGVGLDTYGIRDFENELLDAGVEGEVLFGEKQMLPIVQGIRQGWQLSASIKTTERHLAAGTLLVAKQRLMMWCVGNARSEPRGNAVSITKQNSGNAKIDPLIGIFNAADLMSRNPRPRREPQLLVVGGRR